MATNTNTQYQGAIKNDSQDLKHDAYRLKNDVTQYGRQAGRDTRDAVKSSSLNAYDRVMDVTNQVVSPQTRQGVYNGIKSFCIEQPYIASFLGFQTAFSALPVSLFGAFVLGVLTLTTICASLFVLFWISAAVLVLTPILFLTSSLALGAWVWCVGTFLISRWIYNLVPVSVRGTTEIAMPNQRKFVVHKGMGFGDVKVDVDQGQVGNGVSDGTAAGV